MPVSWTLLLVLALAGAGYFVTRARVVALAGGDVRRLHSRPSYHGWNAALLTALPALFLIAIWRFVQPAANATPVARSLSRSQPHAFATRSAAFTSLALPCAIAKCFCRFPLREYSPSARLRLTLDAARRI